MHRRLRSLLVGRAVRLVSGLAIAFLAACKSDSTEPTKPIPKSLTTSSPLTYTGTAGLTLPQVIVVKALDDKGKPVQGVTVTFAVTMGLGTVSDRVATTDANGEAKTSWTLGKTVGDNELTATADGLEQNVRFTAVGNAGVVAAVVVTPHRLRFVETVTQGQLTAQSVDQFGNPTTPTPTYEVRDPTLVTVTTGGLVRSLRRSAITYVVATAAGFKDSAQVIVLGPGDSPCMGIAAGKTLAVGEVVTTGFEEGSICIKGAGEFTLSTFFYSGAPSAALSIVTTGFGVTTPGALGAASDAFAPTAVRFRTSEIVPSMDVHDRVRTTEEREFPLRAASARAWYRARTSPTSSASASAASLSTIPANAAVGDLVSLNTNAIDYCDKPSMRTGRVVAVTEKAVIVADTANPPGGFTNEEYQAFGVNFDTLTYPAHTSYFGEPADIDGNKRIVLFFTRAVNELSPKGSTQVAIGFYYSRDLLPKTSTAGACPGSNVGEMMYLLVPDPQGVVTVSHTKQSVLTWTNGTVAHELQHLINASRRMYVNNASIVSEERWLNEGLSHAAEELVFFKATGLKPRTNIGNQVNDPAIQPLFLTYGHDNFSRLRSYLANVETQAPIGYNDNDDDLATRGASWSFLRYLADRYFAADERAFWFNVVNSKTSGVENLNALVGDARLALRDWTLAVLLDDLVPTAAAYQQPTWNYRQAVPAATSLPYAPFTRTLANNVGLGPVTLGGNGSIFFRFAVAAGQEAYLTATAGGLATPPSVLLSVVRTK